MIDFTVASDLRDSVIKIEDLVGEGLATDPRDLAAHDALAREMAGVSIGLADQAGRLFVLLADLADNAEAKINAEPGDTSRQETLEQLIKDVRAAAGSRN